MKIVTVVGARPQFIKASVVSHELRRRHTEILVHTGQHYDYNMSATFFDELDIPSPDYNLGISGGTHASMTGKMMIAIEEILIKEKPDWLLVYGDTNSTLAAALAAAKLHIKICHVEAGTRTHSMTNPEEINRICTDHLSTLLLASTEQSLVCMEDEGLRDRGHFVGDPMYDAFVKNVNRIPAKVELRLLTGESIVAPSDFYYLTCHREENTTKNENALFEILKAMNSLECSTIYPVHPRNKDKALALKIKHGFENVILVEPVGYLESIYLLKHAKKVVTDSGGLQREAFFAQKQCVTILEFVCWPETMLSNRNVLAKAESGDILQKLATSQMIRDDYQPFGDGHSAEKIVNAIESYAF